MTGIGDVVTLDDGFRLAVQVSGVPTGPPLLLLAGQANSHTWWDRVRGGFEDRYRVVTLDQRGTGGSHGPPGAWSTRSFADDAASVLAALGVDRAAVYGASMGGRVGQLLAADRPDLVAGLVLACTSPGGSHAVERSAEVRRALSVPTPEQRRAVLRDLFYTPAWPHRPEDSTLLGDRTMTAAESAAHLRVSARHDAWDALPRITSPTLVLHGSDDLMTPAVNAEIIARRVPGAELHVHAGGRHGFFEEFADVVTRVVRSFLDATVT